MITKTTIAAAMIALTSLTAVPAKALTVEFGFGAPGYGWNQGNHDRGDRWRHHRLSKQEVRGILRDRGYRNIRFSDDRGPVFQLRARKHGETYFLVVSARSGEILQRNRI